MVVEDNLLNFHSPSRLLNNGYMYYILSVTTIATSYRKYIARKKYLIMRAAACVIAAHWKGLATRRYVKRYRAAVAVTRKFIIGFMNRNKPKCEQNIYVRKK